MRNKKNTIGIIILALMSISLFLTCDIASPFVDEIQGKIDVDSGGESSNTGSYNVTYAANSATSGTAPATQTKIQDVDLILATNTGTLVRIGYTFAGWNMAADGLGTNYAEGATYTINAALALFANWTMSDITSPNIGVLKVVPAGSFQRDADPLNISTISTAFRMSEKEITRTQFLVIMGTDPSDVTYSSGNSDPVQQINWYHAIAYCNKLSLEEGLTPVYSVSGVDFAALTYAEIPTGSNAAWDGAVAAWSNNGYRLPTEMEWMWAAMGATSDRSNGYTGTGTNTTGYTKGYAGSTETAGAQVNIGDYAWYNGNSGNKTHPVGTAGTTGHPNELGLYDMSGNVWEWNWDWDDTYPVGTIYSNTAEGRGAASGADRVGRGGSWSDSASNCTVAYRYDFSPNSQFIDIGFRVVRP